jgi:hypothetical protein
VEIFVYRGLLALGVRAVAGTVRLRGRLVSRARGHDDRIVRGGFGTFVGQAVRL